MSRQYSTSSGALKAVPEDSPCCMPGTSMMNSSGRSKLTGMTSICTTPMVYEPASSVTFTKK